MIKDIEELTVTSCDQHSRPYLESSQGKVAKKNNKSKSSLKLTYLNSKASYKWPSVYNVDRQKNIVDFPKFKTKMNSLERERLKFLAEMLLEEEFFIAYYLNL